jgi:acyl-CoA reductase-like NAD-dependent aldehyde dehydrogenase
MQNNDINGAKVAGDRTNNLQVNNINDVIAPISADKVASQQCALHTQVFFMTPAVFAACDNAITISKTEICGPVAAVMTAENFEGALRVTSSVSTSTLKDAKHFIRQAEVNMVMVNQPTIGVDYPVPFGARKESDFDSSELGRYAAPYCASVKTASISA